MTKQDKMRAAVSEFEEAHPAYTGLISFNKAMHTQYALSGIHSETPDIEGSAVFTAIMDTPGIRDRESLLKAFRDVLGSGVLLNQWKAIMERPGLLEGNSNPDKIWRVSSMSSGLFGGVSKQYLHAIKQHGLHAKHNPGYWVSSLRQLPFRDMHYVALVREDDETVMLLDALFKAISQPIFSMQLYGTPAYGLFPTEAYIQSLNQAGDVLQELKAKHSTLLVEPLHYSVGRLFQKMRAAKLHVRDVARLMAAAQHDIQSRN